MTKELEELKNELAKADSENDVLAALDGLSRELTDEEVIAVFGGAGEAESGVTEEAPLDAPDWCPGSVEPSCHTRGCKYAQKRGSHLSCLGNGSRIEIPEPIRF